MATTEWAIATSGTERLERNGPPERQIFGYELRRLYFNGQKSMHCTPKPQPTALVTLAFCKSIRGRIFQHLRLLVATDHKGLSSDATS